MRETAELLEALQDAAPELPIHTTTPVARGLLRVSGGGVLLSDKLSNALADVDTLRTKCLDSPAATFVHGSTSFLQETAVKVSDRFRYARHQHPFTSAACRGLLSA